MNKKDYYNTIRNEIIYNPFRVKTVQDLIRIAQEVSVDFISNDLTGHAALKATNNLAKDYTNNLFLFCGGIGLIPRTDENAKKLENPAFDFISEFITDNDDDCQCLIPIIDWYTDCVCNAVDYSIAKLGL